MIHGARSPHRSRTIAGEELHLPLRIGESSEWAGVSFKITKRARRRIPEGVPVGRLISDFEIEKWRQTLVRDGEQWTLRYWRTAEVTIHCDRREVVIVEGDQAVNGMADLLLESSIPSVLCRILGFTSLHASAVAFRDSAVAFAGLSGAGKSTTSARLLAAGWPVVADDWLVPISIGDGRWHCAPTASSLRLRQAQVAQSVSSEHEQTADGRFKVKGAESGPLSLGAIFFPFVDEESDTAAVKRLSPSEALGRLCSEGRRVLGVRVPDWLSSDFLFFSRLATSIPVLMLRLPRGFDDSTRLEELVIGALPEGV